MVRYGGAWPTMATPFDDDFKIDLGIYRDVIAWYIERGVGGLYANCLSSEMYLLSEEERLTLVSEAVRAAGSVPVAATGNLGETMAEHIRFCQRVADAGADVVMLVVPTFYDNDADLENYYLDLAGQVEAPLGLYECPVPRPYHLGVPLVRTLAETGRFVAYKETSCDMRKIVSLIGATEGTPLALLQANIPYLLQATQAGAPGSMCTAAIWLPDLVAAVIDKGRSGDADAERLQRELCTMHLVERLRHPQGTKYLLSKRGLSISPRSRHERPLLTPEVRQALDYCALKWFDARGDLIIL